MNTFDPRGEQGGSQRETFLSIRQILERNLDAIAGVRRQLEATQVEDERARLFLDDVIARRRELEDTLDRTRREASPELLETFVQYAAADPDPGNAEPEPDAPKGASPEEIARWQSAADAALAKVLLDLAQRIQNAGARELVESLAGLLLAHDRRIALGVQEQRDV